MMPRLFTAITIGLTVGIFILDLHTPLGIADGILYQLPLLLTVWLPQRYAPFRLATVFTGLILLGAFFSPAGAPIETWGANRAMSIVGIWATAAFLGQRQRAQVAERIKTEDALRKSEERFRLTIEHANDAIFFLDLNGVIQWISRGVTVLTGRAMNELMGQPITTILTPHSASIAEARLAAVRRGESVPPIVETEILRPDGGSVWLELNATSVVDARGVAGRLIVARDVTDRKRVEEALRQREHWLSRLLEDRERISRDLHDNIIQSIYAIGMGLEECQRLIEKNQKVAAKLVRNAIADLNIVIRDVRSYIAWTEPQISSGQQLKEALTRMARTMEGMHLARVRVKVQTAVADRLSSEQATHLLYIAREAMSNSLRHSGARNATVSLRLRDGHVRFELEDDGSGFDSNDLGERGQGLWNITARAEKLGAQLQILSEPNKGARIVLDILKESKHASAQ